MPAFFLLAFLVSLSLSTFKSNSFCCLFDGFISSFCFLDDEEAEDGDFVGVEQPEEVLLVIEDVDDDGEVGPGDFELVVANFGSSAGPELGDLDRDGEVGPSDFEIVVANFGLAGENP